MYAGNMYFRSVICYKLIDQGVVGKMYAGNSISNVHIHALSCFIGEQCYECMLKICTFYVYYALNLIGFKGQGLN